MYSCSAPVWAHPIAYAHHRECAEPVRAVGCLANYAGGCEPEASSAGVCEIRDVSGVGDGDYGKCWGGSTGAPWERPLTVYLDRYDAIVSGKPARPLGQQDGRPDDRFRF